MPTTSGSRGIPPLVESRGRIRIRAPERSVRPGLRRRSGRPRHRGFGRPVRGRGVAGVPVFRVETTELALPFRADVAETRARLDARLRASTRAVATRDVFGLEPSTIAARRSFRPTVRVRCASGPARARAVAPGARPVFSGPSSSGTRSRSVASAPGTATGAPGRSRRGTRKDVLPPGPTAGRLPPFPDPVGSGGWARSSVGRASDFRMGAPAGNRRVNRRQIRGTLPSRRQSRAKPLRGKV